MRRQLEQLFQPDTIALIGASSQKGSVGHGLMRNLLSGEYSGVLFPVNMGRRAVLGVRAYANVGEVPETIDLAIICTPAATVPGIVEECGQAGVGGLVIISGGFAETGPEGAALQESVRKIARTYQMRIIGPNCLGFLNPHHGLNACFAPRQALPGRLALISQSAAMLTSILDWSVVQGVGFSQVVSLGGMMDVDVADLIDYFGSDRQTSCILIYLEGLQRAHRFMSAARAFARNKPIIVLKAGRTDAGAQALAMQALPRGKQLAILTNAGGPGVLATDYLIQHGGLLASLTEKTKELLNEELPTGWKTENPVDLLEGANRDRYTAALQTMMKDATVDGALVILTPQSMNDPEAIAKGVVSVSRRTQKTILASWMGEADVTTGRECLEEGLVPNYRYPESAVDVFLRMARYRKDLELLYETPPEITDLFQPDHDAAQTLINRAYQENRLVLNEAEARELLGYYGISVGTHRVFTDSIEAEEYAEELGYPVVLKVVATALPHKTEAGGVKLHLWSRDQVRSAFREIKDNVKAYAPDVEVEGILVERMIRHGHELLIGAKKDALFGPVILFGQGGVAVEIFKDVRMGLPPLNMALAKRLIQQTRIYPLLEGYRGQPGVNLEELARMLCTFSYLLMDFPQIAEVDINPYKMDEQGGVALDTRIALDPSMATPPKRRYQHLVISPYPGHKYSKKITVRDGRTVQFRPIRPEDEPGMEHMLKGVSNDSLYMRFFGYIPKVNHAWMTRFTHIDYDREMAIVAETEVDGQTELMGVVRIIEDAWGEEAEYSILVADKWQGLGLGNLLTDYIIDIARERDLKKLVASVLPGNKPMVHMFERRGFTFDRSDMEVYDVELSLL
jgi:acetyltransferase